MPASTTPSDPASIRKDSARSERARDARLALLHRHEALTGHQGGFDARAPGGDARGLAGEQVGVLHAAARLYHFGRGNVRQVHHQPRSHRDQAAAAIGLLLQDRADAKLGRAEPDTLAERNPERGQQARIDPDLAGGRPAIALLERPLGRRADTDAPQQRVALAHGLHRHQLHGITTEHHRREAQHLGLAQAGGARRVNPVGGNRARRLQHQVAGDEGRAAQLHGALQAVDEEPERAHDADREHQRGEQHAELAAAPVAPEQPQRQPQHVSCATLVAKAAAIEREAPRAACGEPFIVRDQHQCRALLGLQREDQVDHARAGRGIEVAGRLVGEQQPRRAGEGARDRDALLLAAGELARVMRQPLREPDTPEVLARARRRIAIAADLQRQHHVLDRGEARQQLEGLEHEADHAPAQARARVLVERA